MVFEIHGWNVSRARRMAASFRCGRADDPDEIALSPAL
jgi:hypothetical protein